MFWSSSIKAFTADYSGGRAPIILVGTHADMVDDQTAKDRFNEARAIIQMDLITCIKINNAIKMDLGKDQENDPEDLKELRKMILNCGLGIADEKVPARWIDLQNALEKERQGSEKLVSFSRLQTLNKSMDVPLENEEDLRRFLEHLHTRGQLLYFPENLPTDFIILDPSLLIQFLNKIMRTSDNKYTNREARIVDKSNQDGMVSKEFILEAAQVLLQDRQEKYSEQLVTMLQRLKITYQYRLKQNADPIFIFPSLLPDYKNEETLAPKEKGPKLKISCTHQGLDVPVPVGFYHHLLVTILTEVDGVNLLDVENKPQIFKTHACFQYLSSAVLIDIYWENSAIYVHINNYSSKKNLTDIKLDVLIRNVERSIKLTMDIYRQTKVTFFLGIECPEHKNCFLSVAKLRNDDEDFCCKRHHVSTSDLIPKGKNPVVQVIT